MPKEGRAAEGGLPQPESHSPGELLRGVSEGAGRARPAAPLGFALLEAAAAELRIEVVDAQVPWKMGPGAGRHERWKLATQLGFSESSLGVSRKGR